MLASNYFIYGRVVVLLRTLHSETVYIELLSRLQNNCIHISYKTYNHSKLRATYLYMKIKS